MDEDFNIDFKMPVSSFDRLFQAPAKIEFINPELDLDINPDHFIKWLELEGELEGTTYKEQCASMCEYSCLYLAMKFFNQPMKGMLRLVCGNFGFWEHWWVEYSVDGKVYIIDLTLQQFVDDAPRLAISEAKYEDNGYRKDQHCDYSYSIEDYCADKKAFWYYKHPKLAEV